MTETEVSRIKIGNHTFGIVGLKRAFENIAGSYAEQPDDVVAEVLINRLSKINHIRKWLEDAGWCEPSGGTMDKPVFIKNITFSDVHNLAELVDFEEGRVVSRTFAQNPSLSITLFAFDKGEGVSTHTAPGDAMLQVLDGEAAVNINGKEMTVRAGQVVVMPANVPHSVTGIVRFKMLLTVVK